jgi:tetratricopeptide (TPR) repeat protein
MKRYRVGMVLAVGILLSLPALTFAESAPEAFARGKSLLEKGDFDAALSAYAAAARGDLDNESYRQQYGLVRRIVDLRKRLDAEKDPERWEYTARALHAFYLDQELHTQAVGVARKIHAKIGTAISGTMLAETELALNNNAEAEKTLAALDKGGNSTPATRALWGVALARLGKAKEAKKLASSATLPDDAGPQMTYSYARLQAVTGGADAALAALQKCFESLPASRLENFKEHAKLCPDFAVLASTAKFAKVMVTESQVAESKCSGGSGCAGCPMRGKCGKAESQEGK